MDLSSEVLCLFNDVSRLLLKIKSKPQNIYETET